MRRQTARERELERERERERIRVLIEPPRPCGVCGTIDAEGGPCRRCGERLCARHLHDWRRFLPARWRQSICPTCRRRG